MYSFIFFLSDTCGLCFCCFSSCITLFAPVEFKTPIISIQMSIQVSTTVIPDEQENRNENPYVLDVLRSQFVLNLLQAQKLLRVASEYQESLENVGRQTTASKEELNAILLQVNGILDREEAATGLDYRSMVVGK
jgi:hypothetical protein